MGAWALSALDEFLVEEVFEMNIAGGNGVPYWRDRAEKAEVENGAALQNMESALKWLAQRTRTRVDRGVEGKLEK